ncbi:MAG: hypothetical protein ACOC2W_01615, partial [bacterium]
MEKDIQLEEYIKKNHINVLEEYIRFITPYYFEPNIEYIYKNSDKILIIQNAVYSRNGDIIELILYNKKNKNERYIIKYSEAHLKLKRLDEGVLPTGKKIPHTNEIIYL